MWNQENKEKENMERFLLPKQRRANNVQLGKKHAPRDSLNTALAFSEILN